jgi:hypothetical protein
LLSGVAPTPLHTEPIEKFVPTLHGELASIINRATRSNREERFGCAAEMLARLESLPDPLVNLPAREPAKAELPTRRPSRTLEVPARRPATQLQTVRVVPEKDRRWVVVLVISALIGVGIVLARTFVTQGVGPKKVNAGQKSKPSATPSKSHKG